MNSDQPPTSSSERDDADLTADQRRNLRQRLIDRRAALSLRRDGQIRAATRTDQNDVGDDMDQASRSEDQGRLLDLAAGERIELAEIDHALAKFDSGTYGVDEDSGEPIGIRRLEAKPSARFTVENEEIRERDARSRRG